MVHEDILTRLEVGLRHEEHAVEATYTHNGLVDEIGTVGGGHHEDALLRAVVQHAKESRNLRCDIAFLAIGIRVGSHKLKLVEAEHKGGLDFSGVKHTLEVVEHTFLIDMTHLHAFDDGIVEAQFLRKALKDKALTAAWRAIEQHAIDGRQFVFLCLFRVLQSKEHLLTKLFLQFVTSRHIVEAVARALFEGDDWACIDLTLLFSLRGVRFGFFHPLCQFWHHLFNQVLRKLTCRTETVFGLLCQGFQKDGLHIIGQLHLFGFQNELLLSRFLHRIGNLFLVTVKRPQIHILPRRLAKDKEIKECAR